MKRLRDLGEDALIDRWLRGFSTEGLAVGPGDDCAVVDEGRGRLRLLKADAIVEGVHFLPDTPPAKVGWKAVARVLSDFAAMGGRPERLMVTLAVDAGRPVARHPVDHPGSRADEVGLLEHVLRALGVGDDAHVLGGAPVPTQVLAAEALVDDTAAVPENHLDIGLRCDVSAEIPVGQEDHAADAERLDDGDGVR